MSLGAKISTDDQVAPWLADIRGRTAPQRIAAEVGPRCTRLVQRNFRSLGGNAKGWPTTHFYGRAAASTNWQQEIGAVIVSVAQIGVRQRLLGGDIKPVKAGALTLPATEEAYGKTAREFDNLEFGFALNPATGKMQPCLKEAKATKIQIGNVKKDGTRTIKGISTSLGTKVFYWLCGGVHQDPDPRVMPSDQQFQAAFDQSVAVLLREAPSE